jgi:hypothetical protein
MMVICVVIPCFIRLTIFTGVQIGPEEFQKVLEIVTVGFAGLISLGIAVLLFYSICRISLFLKRSGLQKRISVSMFILNACMFLF